MENQQINSESSTGAIAPEVSQTQSDTVPDDKTHETDSIEAVESSTTEVDSSVDKPQQDTDKQQAAESEALEELSSEEPHADSIFPLGKIPVEISVELGHFFVDASKKDSLDLGDVITLTSSTPGQVRLVCNDHEVGRGELVDINGQLGVQIIRNWSAE